MIGSERGPFSTKPRPWVVVQRASMLEGATSVTVCAISSTALKTRFRVRVEPEPANGLREPSLVLADKVTTLKAGAIQEIAGLIDDETMSRIDDALRFWLEI